MLFAVLFAMWESPPEIMPYGTNIGGQADEAASPAVSRVRGSLLQLVPLMPWIYGILDFCKIRVSLRLLEAISKPPGESILNPERRLRICVKPPSSALFQKTEEVQQRIQGRPSQADRFAQPDCHVSAPQSPAGKGLIPERFDLLLLG